nr:unnamed protein product [Haemonchus contortus]
MFLLVIGSRSPLHPFGSADVTSLLASMIVRSNREFDLGKEYRHIVLFAVFVMGYTFIAHMIGNLLIAINRFSALCLMQKYDEIWSRKNVMIAIVVQYLISSLACIQIILSDSICDWNDDGICILKGLGKQTDQVEKCNDCMKQQHHHAATKRFKKAM